MQTRLIEGFLSIDVHIIQLLVNLMYQFGILDLHSILDGCYNFTVAQLMDLIGVASLVALETEVRSSQNVPNRA